MSGDFTHYEGSSENIFRLIKNGMLKHDIEVVPVYLMRDPIKRAWSAWNMLGGGKLPTSKATRFVMSNMLSCKYKETILALDSVFAKPLYFFYEDFFHQDNIDSICDALGISRHAAECDKKVNEYVYKREVPSKFTRLFGKSKKNLEAIEFVKERFDNVPWNLEDYT